MRLAALALLLVIAFSFATGLLTRKITKKNGYYGFTGLVIDEDYEVYAEYRGARSNTEFARSPGKDVNITLGK